MIWCCDSMSALCERQTASCNVYMRGAPPNSRPVFGGRALGGRSGNGACSFSPCLKCSSRCSWCSSEAEDVRANCDQIGATMQVMEKMRCHCLALSHLDSETFALLPGRLSLISVINIISIIGLTFSRKLLTTS